MNKIAYIIITLLGLYMVSCGNSDSKAIKEALKNEDFATANEKLNDLYLSTSKHGYKSEYSQMAYAVMKAEADYLINKDDQMAEVYLLDVLSRFDLGVTAEEITTLKDDKKIDNNEEYMIASKKFNDFCIGLINMAVNRGKITLAEKIVNQMKPGMTHDQFTDGRAEHVYKSGPQIFGTNYKKYYYYMFNHEDILKARVLIEDSDGDNIISEDDFEEDEIQ